MRTKKQYKLSDGSIIEIDISPETCANLGFKIGERIITKTKQNGTIIGTAPLPNDVICHPKGTHTLWIELDDFSGIAYFIPHPRFQLLKQLPTICKQYLLN